MFNLIAFIRIFYKTLTGWGFYILASIVYQFFMVPIIYLLSLSGKDKKEIFRKSVFYLYNTYYSLVPWMKLVKEWTYIPEKGIFVVNHQSNLDTSVCFSALPPFFGMAKASLFKVPSFGTHLKGSEYVKVERSNTDGLLSAFDEAARKINQGSFLQIFPEGTRTKDGFIGRFKSGAFRLSSENNIPIIPVVINGTFDILPRNHFLIKIPGRKNKITVKILTPEYPDFTISNLHQREKELLKRVHKIMSTYILSIRTPANL